MKPAIGPVVVRALAVLALLTCAGTAAAAPRSCRDLLVAQPTRQYACESAYAYTETVPFFTGTSDLQIEFDEASPPDPAVFVMRSLINGTETWVAYHPYSGAFTTVFDKLGFQAVYGYITPDEYVEAIQAQCQEAINSMK